jgi:hypothetical protein
MGRLDITEGEDEMGHRIEWQGTLRTDCLYEFKQLSEMFQLRLTIGKRIFRH